MTSFIHTKDLEQASKTARGQKIDLKNISVNLCASAFKMQFLLLLLLFFIGLNYYYYSIPMMYLLM